MCDVIGELFVWGCKVVIVVFVGFMSDYMEVLWDFDIEVVEVVEEVGLVFICMLMLGVCFVFVDGIVDLIEE